jgi:phosphoribosyl 1,2-cyclic phosphodiesterase
MVRFTILASGSRGNCAVLETEGTCILIDAGISAKQVESRLATIGRSVQDLRAVFITHEHGDHVVGLGVLAKRHGLPIYCNRLTMESLREVVGNYSGWQPFQTGSALTLGDIQVESFPVPHDAYDPVGFVFHHRLGSIGFLTDLGHATKLVIERVKQARALVLEANYDMPLLQRDTKRPWSVKQRIISRHGHLSNEAAAEVAVQVAGDKLEDIFLGHLSEDCNTPLLARQVVSSRLEAAGYNHVRLHETRADVPAATLVW